MPWTVFGGEGRLQPQGPRSKAPPTPKLRRNVFPDDLYRRHQDDRSWGHVINDMVDPSVVAGVEMYRGVAGRPAEYWGSSCGVVLIWLRGEKADGPDSSPASAPNGLARTGPYPHLVRFSASRVPGETRQQTTWPSDDEERAMRVTVGLGIAVMVLGCGGGTGDSQAADAGDAGMADEAMAPARVMITAPPTAPRWTPGRWSSSWRPRGSRSWRLASWMPARATIT